MIRLQGPSKRTSSGLLYPVSSVKECNRKGGKCKISRVLQSSVSSPQASPKVEASNRPKQAEHLPTCRKVQNGNTGVHQGLSDSRGMGVVNRLIRHLPSHSHPPKLKEVPKVLSQVPGVTVHPPSLQASHSPTGLYNDCKRSEADGPDKGNQTSPVPGRLADQVPVSGRSTSEHDSGRHDPVLRVDNKSGEIRTETYEYHLGTALVKFTQERWLKLQDLILQLKSKHVLTARCLMLLIGLLASMEKNGPRGSPSHEALSVSPQRALEISSVVGQPPSLDRNHFSTPRVGAESLKRDERCRPSSKDHSIQLFTDASNKGLGTHLEQAYRKGLWSDTIKKATHKCSRAECGFSGPSKVKVPVSKPNSVSCYRQQ